MKTLLVSAALMSALFGSAASADSWVWAPIQDASTLDAHLERCDFARPNALPIYSLINDLQAGFTGAEAANAEPQS
ncbi:hypothetical protein ACOXXX_08345 [Thalassococcus sp. BH17M4-6]|uniref:hypothetical protein n=1 Tax=Thalassococcus sp. BH17M4-6 TaxID=3413148 RepID=UPI003BCF7F21